LRIIKEIDHENLKAVPVQFGASFVDAMTAIGNASTAGASETFIIIGEKSTATVVVDRRAETPVEVKKKRGASKRGGSRPGAGRRKGNGDTAPASGDTAPTSTPTSGEPGNLFGGGPAEPSGTPAEVAEGGDGGETPAAEDEGEPATDEPAKPKRIRKPKK
jgi:hypothetical protein